MNGYYIYTESDESCFDCGRSDMEILGHYEGKPDKQQMLALAVQQYNKDHKTSLTLDELLSKEVIAAGDSHFAIVDTFWGRWHFYHAKTFTLMKVIQ